MFHPSSDIGLRISLSPIRFLQVRSIVPVKLLP